MIEVEKQFQPTEEQLRVLIENAKFVNEVINHDVYYDYPDYRLFKKDIRLRIRNGTFELKIGKSSGVSQELEIKEEIAKYFNVNSLEEFIKNNLIVIIDFNNKRKKYKKENFNIDIDETSFGYKLCEIELMVETEDKVKEAEGRIIDLAKKYNFEIKRIPSKRSEYFRLVKPEVYKQLYGERNLDS